MFFDCKPYNVFFPAVIAKCENVQHSTHLIQKMQKQLNSQLKNGLSEDYRPWKACLLVNIQQSF